MSTATDNPNRLEELEAENAELRRRLEEHDRLDRERAADELVIAEKMAVGLSREQAVGVIRRQREFDAAKKTGK